MFHSIKGASVVMGFQPVNRLTHHMESLFEQLRSKKRTLDRPVLELTFRCLDELRDYHRDLRAQGQSEVDLSALTAEVDASVHATAEPAGAGNAVDPAAAGRRTPPPGGRAPARPRPQASGQFEEPGRVAVTVVFEAGLPLADMKARLVLNRLSSRGRVLSTDPPAEKLDEVGSAVAVHGRPGRRLRRRRAARAGRRRGRGRGPRASRRPGRGRPSRHPPNRRRLRPMPWPWPRRRFRRPSSPRPPSRSPRESGSPAATDRSRTTAEPPPSGPGGRKKAKVAETIRVDSDRLDHLMNLAGELVITKARFVAIARGLEELFRGSTAQVEVGRIREAREQVKALSEAIHSLGRVSDGLQKGVLDTRMVPIGPLFERFRRVIRDLSVSSGKEVNLQIGGEKTELDKRMIDELSDPLIHMVRNAVDHGLEPPDERERAGKPRAGTVWLQASHRGNSVVITVGDDGRGIDCRRIRQKVVAKGLLSEHEAARALRPRPGRLHLAPGPQHRRDHHRDLRPRRRHGHRQEPHREPERRRGRPQRPGPGDHVHHPAAADPGDHVQPAGADLRRDLRDPAGPHRRDRRGPARADLPGAGASGDRDPQEDRRAGLARRRLPLGRPGASLGARAATRTRPATGGPPPTTARRSAPWSWSRTARRRSACWSTS